MPHPDARKAPPKVLTLFLVGATIALIAGLVAKFGADHIGGNARITWFEFVIGAVVVTAVVIPTVTVVGVKQARASTVSYNEYWNGWEETANTAQTNCTRDGACRHTYQCDPYPYTVHYTERVQTGTKTVRHSSGTGKNKTSYTTTEPVYKNVSKTRVETRYHSCPYSKVEYTYTVSTTLGDTYTLGDHWLPKNPQEFRYRAFTAVPSRIPSGVPAKWQAAHDRLRAGQPGGVTKVMKYDNYVLASQTTLLRKYSAAIADFQRKNLMPNPSKGIVDPYLANKVYFVGPTPANAAAWQEALMRANGKIGAERRGDLHLVLVTDPRITNPDAYTLAVQARFQDPSLGKDALSKNGIVVVAGSTDAGKSVGWARLFTGMPMGNERLSAVTLNGALNGVPMTPQALLALPIKATGTTAAAKPTASAAPTGTATTATTSNDSAAQAAAAAKAVAAATGKTVAPGVPMNAVPLPALTGNQPVPTPTVSAPVFNADAGGAVIQTLFGPDGFKRACMKGCGGDDLGYAYLIDQIQPTGGQKAGILAVGFALALAVWGALLALGIPSPAEIRSGQFRADKATRAKGSQSRQNVMASRYANSPEFNRLYQASPSKVVRFGADRTRNLNRKKGRDRPSK